MQYDAFLRPTLTVQLYASRNAAEEQPCYVNGMPNAIAANGSPEPIETPHVFMNIVNADFPDVVTINTVKLPNVATINLPKLRACLQRDKSLKCLTGFIMQNQRILADKWVTAHALHISFGFQVVLEWGDRQQIDNDVDALECNLHMERAAFNAIVDSLAPVLVHGAYYFVKKTVASYDEVRKRHAKDMLEVLIELSESNCGAVAVNIVKLDSESTFASTDDEGGDEVVVANFTDHCVF